jgi:hypothetical protein
VSYKLCACDGDPLGFEVIVRVGNGETRHHVTLAGQGKARQTCPQLPRVRRLDKRPLPAFATDAKLLVGLYRAMVPLQLF